MNSCCFQKRRRLPAHLFVFQVCRICGLRYSLLWGVGGWGYTHSAADGVTYAVEVSERLGRSRKNSMPSCTGEGVEGWRVEGVEG